MYINWKPNYIPGDLVYNHKGEVIRITSSYLKGTRLFYYKTDEIGESIGCILEEALKPIHLTPEILEKNGWYGATYSKQSDDNTKILYRTFKRKGYPTIKVSQDLKITCELSPFIVKLESVSDLQHLLFGLGLNSEMEV